ncbi:hypothetical protein [Lentilitoribacter sp. Alg239-R112]|uniref:hypothetical protein n=1 Tax=Lentilitoribacter sp. Alg239-R112 TaxID=2305987 RepID=UPI0013A6BAFF|nr:hypothetical protein [Lentilitoribacter sp. Alg239-R112]
MPDSKHHYDVQIPLSEKFINRVVDTALKSNLFPSTYRVLFNLDNEKLGLNSSISIALQIQKIEFFTENNSGHSLGIKAQFGGEIKLSATLNQWSPSSDSMLVDNEHSVDFTIPIIGELEFSVIPKIGLSNDKKHKFLFASFAQISDFNNFTIGDINTGPDFREHIRRIANRILLQEFSNNVKLPMLNGFPVSMPIPAQDFIPFRSGQIGSIDFKTIDASNSELGDELHLLMQTKRHLGREHYSKVVSVLKAGEEIGIHIGAKFIDNIQMDIWKSRYLPKNFDDKALPNTNGLNRLRALNLLLLDGNKFRCIATFSRTVGGINVNFRVTIVLQILMDEQTSQIGFNLISIDTGIELHKQLATSAIFFALYHIILRPIMSGIGLIIDEVSVSVLEKFLKELSIDTNFHTSFPGTPLKIKFKPSSLSVDRNAMAVVGRSEILVV